MGEDRALTVNELIGQLRAAVDENHKYGDMIVKIEGLHYSGDIVTGINRRYEDSCAVWLEYESDDQAGENRPRWSPRRNSFIMRDRDSGDWYPVPSAKIG